MLPPIFSATVPKTHHPKPTSQAPHRTIPILQRQQHQTSESRSQGRPSFMPSRSQKNPRTAAMDDSDENSPEDNEDMDEDSNGTHRPVNPPLLVLDNDDPANTLRILISTDNHLGYAERDAIRGMDSFAALEEVLYLAKSRFACDLVLLAGDLFHDNRPSRRTLHKTMEILRRHCLGPNPVRVQILSADPNKRNGQKKHNATNTSKTSATATTSNNATTTSNNNNANPPASSWVNYQDPYYSIDMPIFSIHGNHDDPSRDPGGGELLAALDLLSVCNLVNYFGRQDEVDQIEISPILLQKGETKVALYGLGSLRDERLNRIWERQKVRFLRPAEENTVTNNTTTNDDDDNESANDGDEDEADFFNIFMLHQNRDLGRGTKNCVHESMIPEWMDIVVWGHEHECLIEFFESVVGTFRITQPGSSVATSLVAGEAARKQVGILDIKGKNFRLHPVPLTQVRSFVTTELTLREHREELDPDDPKIESKITKVLEEEVRLMMMRAKEKTKELLRDARAAGNDAGENEGCIKYRLQDPDQVLVRIRVEHMGFASLNNQRFGAKFVGEVANPSDILLFHRKKDPKLASTVKTNRIQPIAPEELERTNMEDLVREQLAVPEGKLQIFGEKELSEALEDYVDKSLNGAISDVAIEVLDKTQKTLIKRKEGDKSIDRDSSVVESLERDDSQDVSIKEETREPMRKRKAVQPRSSGSQANSLQDDDLSSQRYVESSARTTTSTTRQREATHDDDSVDEHVEPTKKTATSRSKAVAPAKKRAPGKRKVPYSLDDSDEIDNGNNDEDELSDAIVDDDDELEDRGPKRPAKATKAAATKATKKTANVPRKTTTTGSSRRRSPPRKQQPQNSRRYFDDSDEQDDDDDDGKKKHHGESVELDVDWGSAATKTQRGGWS